MAKLFTVGLNAPSGSSPPTSEQNAPLLEDAFGVGIGDPRYLEKRRTVRMARYSLENSCISEQVAK